VLCFDGDAAGQRAAARALDRALPLLTAGKSLRFATLPTGEDPDTLIGKFGIDAMSGVLKAARPLGEALWAAELAMRPVDTPERKADLGARLTARCEQIADTALRREYQSFFRNCLFERLRPARGKRFGGAKGRITPMIDLPPPPDPAALMRRSQEILIAVVLEHPDMLDEIVEEFAEIEIRAADLDKLRQEILNLHTRVPGLDAPALKHHLSSNGFAADMETVLSPQVLEHAKFAQSADRDTRIAGWRQALGFWRDRLAGANELVIALGGSERAPEGIVGHVRALLVEVEHRRSQEAELDGPARGR
jgi:DNA primase